MYRDFITRVCDLINKQSPNKRITMVKKTLAKMPNNEKFTTSSAENGKGKFPFFILYMS